MRQGGLLPWQRGVRAGGPRLQAGLGGRAWELDGEDAPVFGALPQGTAGDRIQHANAIDLLAHDRGGVQQNERFMYTGVSTQVVDVGSCARFVATSLQWLATNHRQTFKKLNDKIRKFSAVCVLAVVFRLRLAFPPLLLYPLKRAQCG